MAGSRPRLVIDALPRGPNGLPAAEPVLGRPVVLHHLELAVELGVRPTVVHAPREWEAVAALRGLLKGQSQRSYLLETGPVPKSASVLRTDRLYDRRRLRRLGADPESAVIWRLVSPAALQAAGDELIRRQTYPLIGQFWAVEPAKQLARRLVPTRVRPNAVRLAGMLLMLTASGPLAFGPGGLSTRPAASAALAVPLVLDAADGHLARLQGTASRFGRKWDVSLDEAGEMALHAAVAWSAFARDGTPLWLVVGMVYSIGKYLFTVANFAFDPGHRAQAPDAPAPALGGWRAGALWPGHADVRWHLWIALAALGWLESELLFYTAYYPLRTGGMIRKAIADG